MTADEIRETIKEAIHDELGQYKVDKEQHYKDHLFLSDLRGWTDDIKSTFWRSLVKVFVSGIVLATLVGFFVWGHNHLK